MTAPRGKAVTGPRSKARIAFHDNSDDVRSLWSLYQAAKSNRAVQRHIGPANKGTYLLIAALWETYCEDVLLETMTELVAGVDDAALLPTAIRRAIARDVKEDKHELSPWQLAGYGWRGVTHERAQRLCRELVFNSPKSGHIDQLFRRTLGIADVSQSWSTARVVDPRAALDEHVRRRGELAHRAASTTITKQQVSDFYQLVMDLTRSMDAHLGAYLFTVTGNNPFTQPDLSEAADVEDVAEPET